MVRSDKYLYVLNERPQFANCGPADSNNSPSQQELSLLKDKGELTPEQQDVFLAPRSGEELFDMKKDSEQFHNVADSPDYKEALENIRQVMQQWRHETADTTRKT